jgi:short-subunit dehydrogenase
MLQRNWGRVIFISSEAAAETHPDMMHYGVTKTGQVVVSRGLAEMTKGTRVTVNAVLPGPTRSESVDRSAGRRTSQVARRGVSRRRRTSASRSWRESSHNRMRA